MRVDRGLTASEQDDYLRWISGDPLNREAFARQMAAWRRLDAVAAWMPEHGAEANPDLLAPPRRRRIARAFPLVLACAAALAVGLFIARQGRTPAAADAPRPSQPPPAAADFQLRTLPDGSVIELNRGAEVAVAYSPGERDVTLLRGEAHFTVAKNAARPFVVRAAGVAVRAVGTAFDVRLSGGAVDVLVTEGRVRVTSGQAGPGRAIPGIAVGAGERASFSAASASRPAIAAPVPPGQIDTYLAWRVERLDCTGRPLPEIVERFNRHNRIQMKVADPRAAATRLDLLGFRTSDVEAFVDLLQSGYGVRAARSGDTILLSGSR
jgi:transmembrane sensor